MYIPLDILSLDIGIKGGRSMIAKTAQWGNSIGVRIPSAVAKKAGIGVNSTIEINNTEGGYYH